ncbi:MAG: hypothetical protein HYZ00_08960, partial [Candidatus Hydrogenedentes bacterium]|nr:hypothetical protein [Candidatus Hydrogenedentota bacterium]
VFFYATTLDAGRELWCSNLYAPQTAMIADMMPGKESSMPMKPNVYKSNQGLYVIAFTDMDRGLMLWRYDFASHAISLVGAVAEGAGPLAAVGTRMLFSNADDAHGYEPWFFDGATGVFQLLADLYPGPQPSDPGEAFSWGDRVLFRARTPELGLELWTTDGTPGGTQLLADLNPGPADSAPFGYVVAGQRLYFRAQDQAHGREVWSTDGTPGGTHLVADLWPGEESSDPYNLAPHADRLFFSAKDEAHGEELWVAQPAGNGWQVTLVADILPGPGSSEPHSLIWGPSQGHFLAYSRSEVAEVYRLSSDAPDDPAATWSVARLAGL